MLLSSIPPLPHTHIDVFTLLVKVATCSFRCFLVHICFRPPFFTWNFIFCILSHCISHILKDQLPPQLYRVLPDRTALGVPTPAPPCPPESSCCGCDFACQMSPQPFSVHIGCHPCLTDGGRSRPHSHPVAADGCCIHHATIKNVPRAFNWRLWFEILWQKWNFSTLSSESRILTPMMGRTASTVLSVIPSPGAFFLRVACSIVHEGAVRCWTVLCPSNYDSKTLSTSSLAVAVELFMFTGLRPPYLIFKD